MEEEKNEAEQKTEVSKSRNFRTTDNCVCVPFFLLYSVKERSTGEIHSSSNLIKQQQQQKGIH